MVPALLVKFLENFWSFISFFQGPGKLLKNNYFLYTPGILLDFLRRKIRYYKKQPIDCLWYRLNYKKFF